MEPNESYFIAQNVNLDSTRWAKTARNVHWTITSRQPDPRTANRVRADSWQTKRVQPPYPIAVCYIFCFVLAHQDSFPCSWKFIFIQFVGNMFTLILCMKQIRKKD